MKQKLLCLLAMLAFLLPARLSAFNYKYEGVTLRYEVIDEEAKTCKVSGYKDFSGALVIPDVANDGTTDYCVTEIGEKVFENFSDMTSVVISNSVTSIGRYAFKYCSGLTSVVIPNSVQTIGESAFYGCSGLTSVVIGNSVTSIGSYAFQYCSGLIKSAYPNTLKKPFDKGTTVAYNPEGSIIEDGFVFGPNKSVIYFAPLSLEGEYSIPESVTSIGSEAFNHCRGLTSVVIPKSVTEIGYFAFFSCHGLKKAEFSSVESLCNIKFSSSAANPLEYAHNLYIDGVEVTEIVIPEPITSIGDRTFNGCSGLTSVVIGNSVTSIGESAFQYCKGLTSVEIPNSVESIGNTAFYGCSGLTSVVIGNSVKTIGESAFFDCTGLTSVMIPNSVTKIGASAFTGCSSLISLIFNAENCKSAGSSDYPVFPDSLETVVFGDKVTTIPNYLFYYKTKLTSVVISNSVTSIGKQAFYNCTGLTSVVIGNSVKTIGSSAFQYCKGLTSVVIGNSVTSIGSSAFSSCSGMTSVVIPNSVHTIGDYAFSSCNLDTIIMGHGIETIGSSAFRNCPASRIYITVETPPEIQSDTFGNYKGMLYLQGQAAVNAYDDDKYWGNFNNELMTVPTAIEIEGMTSISGNAGDSFELKAKMTPEDVSLPYILWRSTNPKIATVDHNGVVSLQEYSADDLTRAEGDEDNDGTCRIIAESLYFDGPIAEIVVNNTGVAAASISLDESNLDLKVGQSAKLTATVKNAEDNTVTWTSSNDAVATIDAEGNVTAVAVGEADITATCGSVSASCKVTVTPILAESITISQESWSAHPGETVKLTATVLPEDTTDKTVTWTSSNDAVATVDAEGNVTAVAVGEADITATCGSVSVSCKVTVTPILVESLTIDPTAWSGVEGSEFTIKATVLPENADDKTLTFESSDSSVATVDAEGNVKVLKEGTCVITVSTVDGSDLKAECVVTGLSGVDAIFADPNALVDVYDLNGVMLKKGCSREELNQLKPAVYILRSVDTVVKVLQK